MSNDKVSKKFILKNLMVFGLLLLIIFCVICFNISIGFTVFENIENIPLFIISIILIVIILVIIVVIVLIFIYIIIKNRKIVGE